MNALELAELGYLLCSVAESERRNVMDQLRALVAMAPERRAAIVTLSLPVE